MSFNTLSLIKDKDLNLSPETSEIHDVDCKVEDWFFFLYKVLIEKKKTC